MPISIQHTPVGGVAELARRGGQQQQAVREQGFQFQQDLIGLQANLQQKRDVMLEGFQQQATLQAQQYETTQQERKYQWLNYQTRQDRKFQEEMAELQIEQYKDRQKFDVKLENEQYVAKRKFDFEQELQGLATESQFKMQLEQQKIMGDLAEQQMKTQQKQREFEAAEKAIEEDQWTDRREKDAMLLQLRTKIKAPKTITYSPEVLREAANTGKDPSDIQWAKDTLKKLPTELKAPYMAAFDNPALIPQFKQLYEAWWDSESQKLAEQYGLVPNREQVIKRRMDEGAPREIAVNDQLFEQWQPLSYAQKKTLEGQALGMKKLGQQQIEDMAEEAKRQYHLQAAEQAKNKAERNYHLKQAGIDPKDKDEAGKLMKEHESAYNRYNKAYNEWIGEHWDEDEPRTEREKERKGILEERFTKAAEDMSRIEAKLRRLRSPSQAKVSSEIRTKWRWVLIQIEADGNTALLDAINDAIAQGFTWEQILEFDEVKLYLK